MAMSFEICSPSWVLTVCIYFARISVFDIPCRSSEDDGWFASSLTNSHEISALSTMLLDSPGATGKLKARRYPVKQPGAKDISMLKDLPLSSVSNAGKRKGKKAKKPESSKTKTKATKAKPTMRRKALAEPIIPETDSSDELDLFKLSNP